MKNNIPDEKVKVYDLTNRKKPLATIVLNGYNIAGGGPLGMSGKMRSFKLVKGDLVTPWEYGHVLSIQDDTGRETAVRIAALPADEDSAGLVEFI